MPIFNLTIDDVSPVILYVGAWGDSSHADSFWSSYSGGTFHATQELDDTATFSFHGSAVYLFGAFRVNHNMYTVTLDGQPTSHDGFANPFKFQQNMFSVQGLDMSKQHQVQLQNTFQSPAAPYVDLDFIVITDGDGNPNTQSTDSTIDDGNASIQYSSGWDTMQQDSYFQSSLHRTNGKGNSATVMFHGNAIAVYGGTAPDHGLFSVSLDGGSSQTYNGSAPLQRTQVLLYYASGLSDDQHKVIITNVDENGNWLDLDKVVVSNWSGSSSGPSPTSSQSSSTSTPPLPPSQNSPGGSGVSTSAPTSVTSSFVASEPASSASTSSTTSSSLIGLNSGSHSTFPGIASTFAAPVPLSGSSTGSGSASTNAASGLSAVGGSANGSSSTSTTGPIVGGVLGGVAVIAIVLGILWYYLRHRQPSYPSGMVPPTFKSSSWEEYRDHYSRGTPLPDMHEIPPVEPEPLRAIPPLQYPISPSVAATGGYDTSILANLAMAPQPDLRSLYSPRRVSLSYTDISRMRSPPPTYSQAGGPPSAQPFGHPEPGF